MDSDAQGLEGGAIVDGSEGDHSDKSEGDSNKESEGDSDNDSDKYDTDSGSETSDEDKDMGIDEDEEGDIDEASDNMEVKKVKNKGRRRRATRGVDMKKKPRKVTSITFCSLVIRD